MIHRARGIAPRSLCNGDDFAWDENTSTYEVMSPDEFLVLVDDSSPQLVATEMAQYWFARRGEADVPGQLRSAGCRRFAERVRRQLVQQM